MSLSLFLRNSMLKGNNLQCMTSHILRASTLSSHSQKKLNGTLNTSSNVGTNTLLEPLYKPSTVLSKYFAATNALHSADGKGHDHVKIWKMERVLSVALIPMIPAALAFPNQLLDTAVAVSIVMHTHWGLEAIVVDYVRPILFGDIGPKIGMGLLYIFSAVTLAGCLNLIFNDIGLANAFRELWKL